MIDFNFDVPPSRAPPPRRHDAPRSVPDLRTLQRLHGGDLSAGGRRLLMPGPGHGRTDRSLSLCITDAGQLLAHSFAGDGFPAICHHLGLEAGQGRALSPQEIKRERKAREHETALEGARKVAFCARVWADTLPALGSPVEAYLRSRAIAAPIPDALRFHPGAPLSYDGRITAPALVAIVTGPEGKSCGLHVTALRADGSGKADMASARRMFGSMSGAAVRLSEVAASGELAVAEGIETALSYRDLSGWPTWACLSTSGLRTFNPPAGVKRLAVAGDSEPGGVAAANMLMERAARRCACALAIAPEGQDWNDVLKERAR